MWLSEVLVLIRQVSGWNVGGFVMVVRVKVNLWELTIDAGNVIWRDLLFTATVKVAYSDTAMFDTLTLVTEFSPDHSKLISILLATSSIAWTCSKLTLHILD